MPAIRFVRMIFAALLVAAAHAAPAAQQCLAPAQWAAPKQDKAEPLAVDRLFAQLSQRRAVLLGEAHDNADHHRWQLHTIAGLHALHPQIAIALEMFPHRLQGVLDRWVAGELTQSELLAQTQWRSVWGQDEALYMPIFEFARMHRGPMIAVNVERSLVRKVGEQGWAAIPQGEREGIGDPTPAPPAYVDMLYESFKQHGKEASRTDPAFTNFVQSMLVWDRSMAQGIAEAVSRSPGTIVIGMMGFGHLEDRNGVPRQLAELGVKDAAVLLPWDSSQTCEEMTPELADAVFGIAPRSESVQERPRLGVMLEPTDKGVRIAKVSEDSIAKAAGLKQDDVIESIAGERVSGVDDVTAAVGRQALGTWLPLTVRRDGKPVDIVAKFPPRAKP